MQVEFPDPRTQALFNSARELRRAFGAESAALIRRRLDDLRAVPSLAEAFLLSGRLEELKAERKGSFSMRLKGGRRLILKPSPEPSPRKEDGGLDLPNIRAVIILKVEDYHD